MQVEIFFSFLHVYPRGLAGKRKLETSRDFFISGNVHMGLVLVLWSWKDDCLFDHAKNHIPYPAASVHIWLHLCLCWPFPTRSGVGKQNFQILHLVHKCNLQPVSSLADLKECVPMGKKQHKQLYQSEKSYYIITSLCMGKYLGLFCKPWLCRANKTSLWASS